jgi:competence protein ComFC
MSTIRTALDPFLELLFPTRCCLCDAFGPSTLCDECAVNLIAPVPEPVCPRCGHHVASLPCPDCLGGPPYFVRCIAAGEFAGPLQESIHWLKYRERPQLAEPLGQLLAHHARQQRSLLNDLAFDGIVPVPMHPARQRVRGYNQAERLARVVARELEIELRTDLVRRVRRTRSQVGLTGDIRRNNLSGAFRAANASDLSLLVIDDVSTTGSTFREVAKSLKEAGARAVYCLSLAAD